MTSGGQIPIAPVNPDVVYVPYYNPWRIYGGWVSPYAGFYVAPPPRRTRHRSGTRIRRSRHFHWTVCALRLGFHSWAPNWRGGPWSITTPPIIRAAPQSSIMATLAATIAASSNMPAPAFQRTSMPRRARASREDRWESGRASTVLGSTGLGSTVREPAEARPEGRTFSSRPLAHSPAAAARCDTPRVQAPPRSAEAGPKVTRKARPAGHAPHRTGVLTAAHARTSRGTRGTSTTRSFQDCLVSNSSSSGVRGQSSRNSRDSARSASSLPLVWQCGQ